MLTGRLCFAAAFITRVMPGSAGSVESSFWFIMMRTATAPLVLAQSAMVSPTAGSAVLTGLISAKRLGYFA